MQRKLWAFISTNKTKFLVSTLWWIKNILKNKTHLTFRATHNLLRIYIFPETRHHLKLFYVVNKTISCFSKMPFIFSLCYCIECISKVYLGKCLFLGLIHIQVFSGAIIPFVKSLIYTLTSLKSSTLSWDQKQGENTSRNLLMLILLMWHSSFHYLTCQCKMTSFSDI
jgi:hypothetical protein